MTAQAETVILKQHLIDPEICIRCNTCEATCPVDAITHDSRNYVVDPDKERELVVGPYQGTLGCLRIAFGRGVCGAAAASGQTQLVPDVHAFPGHIACDGRSQSEVVVPVFDAAGALIAVLDVDSDQPAAFDEVDAHWLEKIVRDTFAA